MIIALSSPKHGTGVTTTAALTALTLGSAGPTVLIDLGGDQHAALGLSDPQDHQAVAVTDHLRLIDACDLSPDEQAHIVTEVAERGDHVLIDAGDANHPIHDLLPDDTRRVWVLRPCYLALRCAMACSRRPDSIIVVREPQRALNILDIEAALGITVEATIDIDPAIARMVDAGLLAAPVPRSAAHALATITTTDASTACPAIEVWAPEFADRKRRDPDEFVVVPDREELLADTSRMFITGRDSAQHGSTYRRLQSLARNDR